MLASAHPSNILNSISPYSLTAAFVLARLLVNTYTIIVIFVSISYFIF
jgi:hypothetical protein